MLASYKNLLSTCKQAIAEIRNKASNSLSDEKLKCTISCLELDQSEAGAEIEKNGKD